jgi:flagellar motor switch/type III secretory pathway protein FliN
MPGTESKANPAGVPSIDLGMAERIAHLPAYSRSLLRIEVPVVVTLASDEHAVKRILELGPGTLLHFKKPCDEPLTLSIGSCDVAVGEAVKVGEKFGLRITSMMLPAEKFVPVGGRGGGGERDG